MHVTLDLMVLQSLDSDGGHHPHAGARRGVSQGDRMRIFREWIQRLQGTLLPRRRDADLEHEIRSHMELAAENARRRGLDPADASRVARIEAGGASQAIAALLD